MQRMTELIASSGIRLCQTYITLHITIAYPITFANWCDASFWKIRHVYLLWDAPSNSICTISKTPRRSEHCLLNTQHCFLNKKSDPWLSGTVWCCVILTQSESDLKISTWFQCLPTTKQSSHSSHLTFVSVASLNEMKESTMETYFHSAAAAYVPAAAALTRDVACLPRSRRSSRQIEAYEDHRERSPAPHEPRVNNFTGHGR